MMESSLNLAHQQGRKADQLLHSKKYEESMFCHRRAAEYLLQALQLSPSQNAQESIQLQHQFHLKQQEIIQDKINRIEKMENRLANKELEGRNQSTQTEAKLMFSPNHYDSWNQESNFRVMQALAGTDSLVGHLLLKSKPVIDTDVEKDLTVGYNASQENITLTKTESDTDYESVINRLLQENLELKKEVSQLQRELDNSKKDNRYLTDRVFSSDRVKRHSYPDEEHGGMAIPDMELPPLEMPQFDFDSLQVSTSQTDRGGSIFSTH